MQCVSLQHVQLLHHEHQSSSQLHPVRIRHSVRSWIHLMLAVSAWPVQGRGACLVGFFAANRTLTVYLPGTVKGARCRRTLRAGTARLGGGLGHARQPAWSALRPSHEHASGWDVSGTMRPPLSPQPGQGRSALHPRRQLAARTGAPRVSRRPARGTLRVGQDGVSGAAPRLLCGKDVHVAEYIQALPLVLDMPMHQGGARAPLSPAAAVAARWDDRGGLGRRVSVDKPTTAAGFDTIRNNVGLLSDNAHAIRTRSTATATGAAVIIRDMCSWSGAGFPEVLVVHYTSEVFRAFMLLSSDGLEPYGRLGLPQEHKHHCRARERHHRCAPTPTAARTIGTVISRSVRHQQFCLHTRRQPEALLHRQWRAPSPPALSAKR